MFAQVISTQGILENEVGGGRFIPAHNIIPAWTHYAR